MVLVTTVLRFSGSHGSPGAIGEGMGALCEAGQALAYRSPRLFVKRRECG